MMKMVKHIVGLMLCCLCMISSVYGQREVSFTAQANAKEVVLGDNFQVFFKVNHPHAQNFKPPTFKNFEVLSGPNQASSVSNINGKVSVERSFSYHIRPKKIGTLEIGKATISIDKKAYYTKPIAVKVIKAPKAGSTKGEKVYLKAIVSQDSTYPGQLVTIEYKLYTQVHIQQYHIVSEPAYDGFHTSRIRRFNGIATKEIVDGVPYTTQVLRKVALYPHQVGKLTIDPLKLRISVPIESKRNNMPFGFMVPTESYFIRSNPTEIMVNPLPSPAPASFSGGVGTYEAKAMLDDTTATTDDALTLRIVVEGEGDIKRLTAPNLVLSDTFEVYDPNVVNEDQGERNGTLYGRKIFEYLILPKYAGRYNIVPEFSYFDAKTATYKTATIDTFTVNIKKGIHNTNVNKKPVVKEKELKEIATIQSNLNFKRVSQFVGSPLFWGLFSLPIIGFLGAFAYRRYLDNKPEIDVVAEKRNKAQKVAKQRLSQAEKHLKAGDNRAFYTEISKGLLGYATDKFNIAGSALTKNNVEKHLSQSGANPAHITRFMSLLTTCERAIYAGGSNSDANNVYNEALSVIVDIEG